MAGEIGIDPFLEVPPVKGYAAAKRLRAILHWRMMPWDRAAAALIQIKHVPGVLVASVTA